MMDYAFDFHGLSLRARPSGVLWWPDAGWLIVADLHLGKSGRMARRGGALLPPYETLDTLNRLRHEIEILAPRRVISLGDAFDDLASVAEIDPSMRGVIHDLAQGREWIWVTGNHDPLTGANGLPGLAVHGLEAGSVQFRHEADANQGVDISGHFHPVIRLGGVRRRAFLIGSRHLILPAFGAYTGGLLAQEAPLMSLCSQGIAAVCYGGKVLPVPLGVRCRQG